MEENMENVSFMSTAALKVYSAITELSTNVWPINPLADHSAGDQPASTTRISAHL
jgi:hypothetical protein